jgi:hypothetical protein
MRYPPGTYGLKNRSNTDSHLISIDNESFQMSWDTLITVIVEHVMIIDDSIISEANLSIVKMGTKGHNVINNVGSPAG